MEDRGGMMMGLSIGGGVSDMMMMMIMERGEMMTITMMNSGGIVT